MIRIDKNTIFKVIKERKPKRVAINGPEGLLRIIERVADDITKRFGIEVYIIGDTCYGSCDINYHAAEMLNADLLFHVGHTISMEEMNYGKIVMINAFDDIKFDDVIKKSFMLDYKRIGLVTDSQHLNQVKNVVDALSKKFTVIIGRGKGQLNNAQVFGCEFYPAYDISNEVDAYFFLGQSMFHAAGVAIATNKPTFMLDPYFNEIKQVNEFAEQLKKRSILAIYKALDAKKIAIVAGLKEGQFMLNRVIDIKHRLAKHKDVMLIALTDVTADRLELFDADAFIQIACPRISTDNPFKKPVLSAPQAYALIDLLEGRELDADKVFGMMHWL